MNVDLAGAAEDNAVGIDQQHSAFGLDRSQDPARAAGGIDAVERHPRIAVRRVAGALVEIDRRVLADVELPPRRDRALRGLRQRHRGLAAVHGLARLADVLPQAGIAGLDPRIDDEAARGQPVRHRRGGIGGRVARRLLGLLQGLDGAGGAPQGVLRLARHALGIGLARLRRRGGRNRRRRPVGGTERPRLRLRAGHKQRQRADARQQRPHQQRTMFHGEPASCGRNVGH